jgi:hypothetical protein
MTGFGGIRQPKFCDSDFPDYAEPLHVRGFDATWQSLNQAFYKKNGLIHHYDNTSGRYEINFKVTGFDRDPLLSLIVEAKKDRHVDAAKYDSLNNSVQNYNRYAFSLLRDAAFAERLKTVLATAELRNLESHGGTP